MLGGLRQADQRNARAAPRPRIRQRAGAEHERGKIVEPGAGRLQQLGQALGRGPAQPPVRRAALGDVETGRIQPRAPRQARRREPVLGRQRIDGAPNIVMPHG